MSLYSNKPQPRTAFSTVFLAIMAMLAFSANSILGRLALEDQIIDASSFTFVRLSSGALALWLMLRLTKNTSIDMPAETLPPQPTSKLKPWVSAFMLYTYAICFSLAYIRLDTATGALILFAVVQITMIVFSVLSGHKIHFREAFGLILAFGGFIYLLLPGIQAPSLIGATLMSIAGLAWGAYSLIGQKSNQPLIDTGKNFIRTLPFSILTCAIALFFNVEFKLSTTGIVLGLLSGVLASAFGYSLWYLILPRLKSIQAGVLQLTVPIFAAFGGALFANETLGYRLLISFAAVIGGILIVLFERKR